MRMISLSNITYVKSKTKAVKFRNGGSLSADDHLIYKNMEIKFIPDFCYMGITFSTKLSPSAHLDKLVKKARTSTGTLCQKLNPQKIPFQSATRLLNGVVVPSGTYGLDIYEMNEIRRIEHLQKLENHFWKVWCGVSQHHSSRNLRHHLLENDFLNLQGAKGIRRRIITLFLLFRTTLMSLSF